MRRVVTIIAEGLVLAGLFAIAFVFLCLAPELDAAILMALDR
jgi:hypothetical protein